MSTLKERIEEIMAAKSMKISDLVRITGLSSSAISQWLGKGNGRTIQQISNVGAAYAIEVATGYSALWAAEGKGPKMAGAPAPVAPGLELDDFCLGIVDAFSALPANLGVKSRVFLEVLDAIEKAKVCVDSEAQKQQNSAHAADRSPDKSF